MCHTAFSVSFSKFLHHFHIVVTNLESLLLHHLIGIQEILSLVELDIDCIIHADIPWPVIERNPNPTSASCNAGEFFVIIFISWFLHHLLSCLT